MFTNSILYWRARFLGDLYVLGKHITVNKAKYFELTDVYYELDFNPEASRLEVQAPVPEETREKEYIIGRALDCSRFFSEDPNTRRASFTNSYDGFDNHCISYFHFIMRDQKLNLNVYVRSQNFKTNWMWDNYVYADALNILHSTLTQKNIHCELGTIKVHVASLHTPYE